MVEGRGSGGTRDHLNALVRVDHRKDRLCFPSILVFDFKDG